MFRDIIHRSVFIQNRTTEKVRKYRICINVPSSQTFRSYLIIISLIKALPLPEPLL
jgi:hypothetical protein